MKLEVQKAYVVGVTTERAIARSDGEVYTPSRGWHVPAVTVQVVAASPVVYENWADVPHAWLGMVPYWGAS